jgi:hypothetical protein
MTAIDLTDIWSLLKRGHASFATADLDALVRIVKRKLQKISAGRT